MSESFVLLPAPRSMRMAAGQCILDGMPIVLEDAQPHRLLRMARRLRRSLPTAEVVARPGEAPAAGAIVLRLAPQRIGHAQGYSLAITPDGVVAEGHDEAGLFYAVCTLSQLIEQQGRTLSCLDISDWPDFPARGVMLDISRDKVPTMQTLFELVDMLAGWKINEVQLYTEHTFAYRNHPVVWADASPMTGQEIMQLDAFCRERFIDLVPNQNCFGHMHRWLVHAPYAHLAEINDWFDTPWGTRVRGPFSLCPGDPGSLQLVQSMFEELLPHFSSHMFNVGCDETVDLGQGRSKEECAQRGVGRVYLDFLLKIYQEVTKHRRTMQFWGDIILRHPELIPELPKDVIALEWGYEADHPFDKNAAQFAASGIRFYVCPGTSSWNSLAGRTDNALANLRNAAENGLKHGACGYLNTDWGDRGHWQVLPVSYLGFAAGAAYSWALDANRGLDVAAATSVHAFRDGSGRMGRLAYDLGNVYQAPGVLVHNASVLNRMLQVPLGQIVQALPGLRAQGLEQALGAIDQATAGLATAQMARPDAGLIKDEFRNTARLLRHACRRGLLALTGAEGHEEERALLDLDMMGIIQEYARLWLARNRSGGLAHSIARLEQARQEYGWNRYA